MKMRLFALFTALLLVLTMTACGDKVTTTGDGDGNGGSSSTDEPTANEISTAYADKEYGFQQEMPQKGDQVVIMHTSMGDIAIRLFPEAAPKAVENFVTHAKDGYYDGLTFHRVIQDFMIQGGDPNGTGTGGESFWGKAFEDEFDQKLMNIRGSLAMANSGVNTNGSQFFINTSGQTGQDVAALKQQAQSNYDQQYNYYKMMYEYYGDAVKGEYPTLDRFIAANGGIAAPRPEDVPDEVWAAYAKHGGNIHLDGAWRASGGHTVFGQVYDGLEDVVVAIEAVETDDNDKPKTAVTITGIEIKTF